MNPLVRRTLTFVLMVAAGLATILLLAEDSSNPARPLASAQRGDGRGLRMLDREERTREELELGDVEFTVHGEVELPDGRVEERPLYRVHVERGSPDADGFYVVDRPVITFLDELSGEPRGRLTALAGRFDTGTGGLGDGFGLDVANLAAERLVLEGEVRGELPLDDGTLVRLEAERLDVDQRRQTVHGPGLVVWSRDDLTLSGHDLHWDGTTRLLTYESRAEISWRDPATAALTTLRGAGGLSWELPADGSGRGELHGPVTGSDEAGHSLRALRLLADADAGTLELRGEAELRGAGPDGTRRFAADVVRLRQDAEGALTLEEALGNVRGARFGADGGASTFHTERLVREGTRLRGPGPVRWTHAGVEAEGRDLSWHDGGGDASDGALEIHHDVELVGGHDAPAAWRGARLSSPRGLSWRDGELALHGPLAGSLPDGSRLGAERLLGDEPQQALTLLGEAWVERPLPDGGLDRFEGDAVQLWRDAAGAWSRLRAEGAVRLLAERPEDAPLELRTDELVREGALVHLPGPFRVVQGALSLAGHGLRLDELARRADVASDAVLASAGDGRTAAAELHAPGGLTWWWGPPGAAVAEGHGELRGPVRGHDAAGAELAAERVECVGVARELRLLGDARVTSAAGERASGPELWVVQDPAGNRLGAPAAFALEADGLAATGEGLTWDAARGDLAVERGARLEQTLEAGGIARLACSGPLRWHAPPGAADPLLEGHGSLRGDVSGEHPTLGAFHARELLADGRVGRLELEGPARLERPDGAWLRAADTLIVQRDDDGALRTLEARGDVRGAFPDAGALLRVAGERLLRDAGTGSTRLEGAVELVREEDGEHTTLRTDPGGWVEVEQDAAGAVSAARAAGRVHLERGELRAVCDRLAWDVADDHLRLEGNCRFLAMGAWMSMERVEIWPRQMRWFIPRAEMELTPPDDG